jgi:3-methyl-2-oxobutanoate hydroxymethyltransferase
LKRITLTTLRRKKQDGVKIASLTAYDATFSALLDNAGVDVILVGDSLGMVIQGHDSTLPVSVDDVVYHLRCVSRASRRAFIIGDMPFMSYAETGQAIHNAARLMQEGGAHMVKLEGGEIQVEIVGELSRRGIPVCAHLGLQPQAVHKLGGYHVQGRETAVADRMMQDAGTLVEAGADILLLECVPRELARAITESVTIPVIGIGAGPDCDGQILVLQDMLGLTQGRVPSFVHNFAEKAGHPLDAVNAYIQAVRQGTFPTEDHCFS